MSFYDAVFKKWWFWLSILCYTFWRIEEPEYVFGTILGCIGVGIIIFSIIYLIIKLFKKIFGKNHDK